VTIKDHGFEVDHANFHACMRRNGFCSPFVSVQPGLVTHAPAQKSHTGSLTLEASLGVGLWTLIAHFRMYIDGGVRIDIAKGITVDVKGIVPEEDLNQISDGLRAFSYALAASTWARRPSLLAGSQCTAEPRWSSTRSRSSCTLSPSAVPSPRAP